MPFIARPVRLIAFMLVLLTNPVAIAQGDIKADSKEMAYAEQYARCATFFAIAVESLANLGDHKTALTYQEYQYGASMYLFGWAHQGRDEETAEELAGSLVEAYEKQMLEILDGRDENVSILIDQHGRECIDLMREPPEVFEDLDSS